MEPVNDNNAVPRSSLSQTSKRYIIVPPQPAPLNDLYDKPEKNTSPEIPAGLPIIPSEDFRWYGESAPDFRTPTPTTNPRMPGYTFPPASPSYNIQVQRSSTPPQQEQSPLVRSLPYPSQRTQGISYTQSTGTYRWEQQSSRYPAELLQIMESETREMQVLTTKPAKSERPKGKVKRKRRVPEMRQVTAVECGAACLGMVLNYYGYGTSISDVQERCGVGRDGLTALEIVKSARLYGLRVRAVSLNLDDFRFVALPAIIHWEFNHFLVVERWSSNHIDVLDPAIGRRRLTREEFDEGFTGVAILLEPGAQFEQKAQTKALTLWSYMRSLLHMRTILFQIIGTSLLLQLLGLGAPLLTAVVIDNILPQKNPNILVVLGIGMLILILMQGITGFLRSSLLIYLQTRLDTDMMLNFFEHMLSLPYRFFQLRLNGDLLARMNSNLAIRDLLTNQLISTILDGGTVIVYFIILLLFSKLIAVTTLIIGFVQIFVLLVTSPAIRRLTQRDLEAQGKTQGYMNEILSGIATLKAAGAENRAFARWENLFFDEMNISLRLNYISSIVGSLLGIVGLLSPLLLLWIGATQVINGTMQVGTMLALNTLAIEFLGPLGSLASTGQSLQIIRAHFTRVADIIGTQPEQDPALVQTPHQLRGQIELKHVSFRYDQNAPLILNDINGKIKPGQKVALVGRTGSGKSTLGKLLVGLMLPTKGSIMFDGVPLDQLNYQDVRSQFGVVLQESFIFSGSVKDNIALNNPDMDMDRVIEAARIAAIDEDIEKMPMGYDTLVSEGGSAFSGGQRQRVALARALAHHPALLLLDEATSALDVVTEQAIERNLNRLPCTQVIIAHRLSTIRNADVIMVLDQGHIVEQGSHEQLLRGNGFYRHLIQTQLQNGEIAAL
ncbi:MAG TPA: ABC transporter transmembrane domain-containing protein [Ktedonobacteraceae bacterium]